jgi:hypothetical protein
MNGKLMAYGALLITSIFLMSTILASCYEEPRNNLSPSKGFAASDSNASSGSNMSSQKIISAPKEYSYKNTIAGGSSKLNDYQNATTGISLKYPEDWSITNARVFNWSGVYIFASPTNPLSKSTNILILYQPGINLTLDQANTEALRDIKNLTDARILYENDTSISGIPAKMITYTATVAQKKLKYDYYFLMRDNTSYQIAYTATPGSYPAFLSKAREIIESIRFI